MFFGKQKFDVKQLKMNKFIFNAKELEMIRFIKSNRQLTISFSNATLEVSLLGPYSGSLSRIFKSKDNRYIAIKRQNSQEEAFNHFKDICLFDKEHFLQILTFSKTTLIRTTSF